ncbi:MAG: RnfH family protein [Woeseia sp.]
MSGELSDIGNDDRLYVEVVFALPDRQELITVLLEKGATVADAIGQSSIETAFAEWDLGRCSVGIWGRLVERDQLLQQGDRVEIYRPLRIEPRDARRALAAQGRSMGKPGGAVKDRD